jgi:hypothetical protein
MSQLGMGAMIHYLGGGSENDPAKYYGRKVVDAYLEDNRLALSLADGTKICLWDNGQSCCEHRYMTTDDDVKSLVGGKLKHIEAKEAREETTYGEPHEMVFIEVATNKGFITVCTHNEHNGYYGGFGLTLTEERV